MHKLSIEVILRNWISANTTFKTAILNVLPWLKGLFHRNVSFFLFFFSPKFMFLQTWCGKQLFIRSSCFPACEIWAVGSQREKWWMLTGGWVSGPFPQCSLSRREHSQHSPTPSLLPHLMSKCNVPHTPTTLTQGQLMSSETEWLQSWNYRSIETRGLSGAPQSGTDSGATWVGWAEVITLVKPRCNANASLAQAVTAI